MFCKKGVFNIFAKFRGKYLYEIVFPIKTQVSNPGVFLLILQGYLFTEHLWQTASVDKDGIGNFGDLTSARVH